MFSGIHPVAVIAAVMAVILIIAYALYKKRNPDYKDIHIPMPDVLRQGLEFAHYASLGRTFEQVKDHVSVYWSGFYGDQELIEQMKSTERHKFLLDLGGELFIPADPKKPLGKRVVNPEARAALRAKLEMFRAAGVLHKVRYLYPIDEPQLTVLNAEEHLKAIKAAKEVVAEFPELSGVKWACIYLNFEPWWNLAEHDVVGVDSYKQKSQVLTIGEHARLMKSLLPHQTTMLLPGSAYGQNPDPFVAYAHTNERVEMVVSFLWFADPNHGTDGKKTGGANATGLEVADEAFRNLWIEAAHKVTLK